MTAISRRRRRQHRDRQRALRVQRCPPAAQRFRRKHPDRAQRALRTALRTLGCRSPAAATSAATASGVRAPPASRRRERAPTPGDGAGPAGEGRDRRPPATPGPPWCREDAPEGSHGPHPPLVIVAIVLPQPGRVWPAPSSLAVIRSILSCASNIVSATSRCSATSRRNLARRSLASAAASQRRFWMSSIPLQRSPALPPPGRDAARAAGAARRRRAADPAALRPRLSTRRTWRVAAESRPARGRRGLAA